MTERCILFADVAGSTSLYEKLGDAEARRAIERVLKRATMAVEGVGGRVLKHTGDGVLADFAAADAGLAAASEMQQRVHDLPPIAGNRLAIRIGFHWGPVIEGEGDIFGDAVNLAARMADLARPGQIIATKDALDHLSALAREGTREMPAATVKGKAEPVAIGEVLWRDEGTLTLVHAKSDAAPEVVPAPHAPRHELILRCGEALCPVDADHPSRTMGRDPKCDLVVGDPMASRQHARVDRRGERFVLADISTNGTWVCVEGEAEFVLRREETTLHGRGRISLGHPEREESPVVHFALVAR